MTDSEIVSRLQALQAENQRLKRAVEELALLNDLAREIGASLNSQEIMQTIIRRSLRAVHAEQGVITLIDQQALTPMKTLVRTRVSSGRQQAFHLEQSLQGWMLLHKMPLVINAPAQDERFRGVPWDDSISSLLCVPLLIKSELKGILTLYNKKDGREFSSEDQRLLGIIAAQSAQVMENARLYEEEQALLRMQEQVRLAAQIQLELLPKAAPQIEGYEIASMSLPAQSVGGDYFDFIPVDDHRWALCLGDVTGKGLPASLLMANLQATIRGQTLSLSSVSECLQRANRLLHQSTDDEKFATVFYALLDTQRHLLCYANAGHNDPLLFSGSQPRPRALKTGGIMLGVFSSFPFQEETIALQPGDLLLIYSDGVTEAKNVLDEDFGEERLLELVQKNLAKPAQSLIDEIIQAVQAFAGQTPQHDDLTLMIMRRRDCPL
ncbi:MAG: PP2C family protein-serine/threonine phosphatase [bacterium]